MLFIDIHAEPEQGYSWSYTYPCGAPGVAPWDTRSETFDSVLNDLAQAIFHARLSCQTGVGDTHRAARPTASCDGAHKSFFLRNAIHCPPTLFGDL